MPQHSLAIGIARALADGMQDEQSVSTRLSVTTGRSTTPWMLALVRRYLRTFATRIRPREREVVRFVQGDHAWRTHLASTPQRRQRPVARWLLDTPPMLPAQGAADWPVQKIEDIRALADWLGTTLELLDWFADRKALNRHQPGTKLHHYHYKVLAKRSGGLRIIEAPQSRLKEMQRRILRDVLEKIPPYYSAAHGFVKGRSVRTFAAPHVGQQVVLRIDLQDFFPTIGRARVQALFRTIGYSEQVADILGLLCTNTVPRGVFTSTPRTESDVATQLAARNLYGRAHLPQGAPTSPLIASLCAYRMDCRLTGLADWAGAVYTRYADDIAISGKDDFARYAERYAAQASAIAMAEGWSVQHHKTRIMRRSVRQHLAGIVVNEKLNVTRASFDQLKATLVNCQRFGPASQNREQHPDFRAHLRGRVGWITSVNPARGRKLTALFERIHWE